MTALRLKNRRQSSGYYPQSQEIHIQEYDVPLRRLPLSFPGFLTLSWKLLMSAATSIS